MKKSVWLLLLICCGCEKKADQAVFKVMLLNANTIRFNNIDHDFLINAQHDTIANAQWQSLLPVCRMPADTDMKDYQLPQPGKYLIKNDAVIFSADTPFKKHSPYFARYYRLHDDSSIWTLIRDKWKHRTPQYTECTFTP